MSHIALIGASGGAGSRILKELSDRGHTVTAIARHPEKIASLPNVTAKQGDALDKDALVALFKGHDAVVSAVKFGSSDPTTLIAAVKTAGVKRYLVVGGAGSLEIAPGQRLIDQPDFPDAYRPEASRGAAFLDLLKQEKDLDWSFLSPSAEFFPGQRTGTFRLGKDALLSNDKGSSISFEDYAVALVDEIENPAHSRQRFTVGY
ncbi:NAD(P)-dependent oxidoreductase [Pectobacterium aroidearum]|uniref:NAD(P)-dependent oxidoreductase n=1 Tax=Pectobacterium aroidearum TaxID=1201031 RepID=A0ABR5ZDL8_9GAMM|nr:MULTISPECIES: NAD(P)-dependent oxidoreductase [Pectobacterium]MBA5199891.1 NAD(P)-dependent oxidoreductase [Pectobacterium aroidearum]MBA5228117.1 NAD(P)-dependent oxidoreductase [Pectobacterium aroidearum]MBA5232683.1 NAD(P)-dependent oxidoreductase [Pectobacterium aroidearum]MBA5236790.1 NAD(P)-dependent oxidoreductase [Pectobacterium aroidearum]MBA5737641.1 NAD(P)-dependent oxidoreductase [Pectobacterium aroidearum]